MNESLGWLIVALVGSLGFVFAVYSLGAIKEHRKSVAREAEFHVYFRRTLTQEDADRILQRLAMEFHHACTGEISFLNTIPCGGERDSGALESNCAERLQERADAVKATKNLFWKAYDWFGCLGYSVRPKYGDYLPK